MVIDKYACFKKNYFNIQPSPKQGTTVYVIIHAEREREREREIERTNEFFIRSGESETDRRNTFEACAFDFVGLQCKRPVERSENGRGKGIGRAGADLRRHTEVNGCEEEAAVSGSGSSGRAHNRTTSPLPTLPTPASHTTHTASAFLAEGGGGGVGGWRGGRGGGMHTVRVTVTITTVFAFILAKKGRRVNRPNQIKSKSICIIDQYTKQLRSFSASRISAEGFMFIFFYFLRGPTNWVAK